MQIKDFFPRKKPSENMSVPRPGVSVLFRFRPGFPGGGVVEAFTGVGAAALELLSLLLTDVVPAAAAAAAAAAWILKLLTRSCGGSRQSIGSDLISTYYEKAQVRKIQGDPSRF